MSIVDNRVFCEKCGSRLVGWAEEMNHKGRCLGRNDGSTYIFLKAVFDMAEAIRANYWTEGTHV